MKAFRNTILVLLLLIASAPLTYADTQEIEDVYRVYREALLAANGEQAWQVLDSRSRVYYEDILSDALTLKRDDLEELDLIAKFIVLRVRMEFRKDQLEQMDGEGVFATAVQKSWISVSTVQSVERLDKVIVDKNLALGFVAESKDVPVFYFVKEENGWKLALLESLELGKLAIQRMIKQSGMNEDDFIRAMLEQASENKIDNGIFEGPRLQ